MSTDSTKDELLSLIKQTGEQVTYFQELGVTGIVIEPGEVLKSTKQNVPQSGRASEPPSNVSVFPVESTRPRANQGVFQNLPGDSDPGLQTKPQTTILPQDSLFGDLTPPTKTIVKSSESFEEIWSDVGNCTRCPLHEGRTNIVHTEGSRKARLMFVGEAPGADEDAQSRPFVGRAGQLLTKIIESLGLKREDVLIGNVNRCRPPGNRPPTSDEAAMCKPFLLREIASVAPDVIVVLGNTAMKNLLEVKEGITRLRGIFQDYKGIKIMPTFHPAYLLRDPSKKREMWEDLKKVRDYLDNTPKREANPGG